MFASVRKFANAASPCFVAASFQILAHDAFNIICAQTIQPLNIAKAGMIRQGHLNDLINVIVVRQVNILRCFKFNLTIHIIAVDCLGRTRATHNRAETGMTGAEHC